jgi:hypothetical protein
MEYTLSVHLQMERQEWDLFHVWLYFRNYFRRKKNTQISWSSVTRVVTNVENRCYKIRFRLHQSSSSHTIGLYPYPRPCLLYFTLVTTSTSDKYAYLNDFNSCKIINKICVIVSAMLSGRLNFIRLCRMILGPQCRTCWLSYLGP